MDVAVRFFGDNMPERLRSTALALTGLVAAACLVTIGLTLRHGAPLVSSGPIHAPTRSEVSRARIVSEARPAPAGRRDHPRSAPRTDDSATRPASAAPSAESAPVRSPVSDSGGGPDLVAEPSPGGRKGGQPHRRPASVPPEPSPPPAPVAAPEPVEEPVATPSSEPLPPVAEPPVEEPSSVPGNGHAYGKGSGTGPGSGGPPGLAKK